jgi:2-(1,2-epoxy-1,2-dihydrophenyl)acetyl-CoA isomerase
LSLNRPDSLNALDTHLMRQLASTVRAVAEDETVRCVILTGEGRGFCSGGDTRAIRKAADSRAGVDDAGAAKIAPIPRAMTEERARWLRRSAEASRLLHEMPKPTIAMINGACAGAGMSLAAACDMRFAAESAKFRLAFTTSGVSGDYGGAWLWTRILGPSKARQLYFIDAKRSAAEALEFGLVDRVYPDEGLRAEVLVLAHQLAALPGQGVAYAKANLNAALTESLSANLDRESLSMMLARNVLIEAARNAAAN